jgi:hypothetical protein
LIAYLAIAEEYDAYVSLESQMEHHETGGFAYAETRWLFVAS